MSRFDVFEDEDAWWDGLLAMEDAAQIQRKRDRLDAMRRHPTSRAMPRRIEPARIPTGEDTITYKIVMAALFTAGALLIAIILTGSAS